jgi:hypothetical protein
MVEAYLREPTMCDEKILRSETYGEKILRSETCEMCDVQAGEEDRGIGRRRSAATKPASCVRD